MVVLIGGLEVGLDNRASPDRVHAIQWAPIDRTVAVALVKRDEQRGLLMREETAVQDVWNNLGEIGVPNGNRAIVYVVTEIGSEPHEV